MALELRADSRYLRSTLLKDELNNEYFADYKPYNISETDSDEVFELSEIELGRWEKLSNINFDQPFLWWAIPESNDILDPFPEIDFSDAPDQPVYPNYQRNPDLVIEYPIIAQDLSEYSGDINIGNLQISMPGVKSPEHFVGSRLTIPSRGSIQRALVYAQNR